MTTTNPAPASRRRLWIAIGVLAALIVVLIVVVFAIGNAGTTPTAEPSTGTSEAPAAAASTFKPEDLVDCRLSLATPQGIDEGGKALSTREGPDGFEVDTQWGWFDENGVAHTDSDPSYQPESYATHRWVIESEIRGFTCDGGTSWTWLKKQ
jgi:hypothetical protein